MSIDRTFRLHTLWTGFALILPLLYLQQLAPHHHAAPEAAPEAAPAVVDHHANAPHHHTHDHHHHGESDQPVEAHHHHTLAAHLDLHAPPAVPVQPDNDAGVAAVITPSAPSPDLQGHRLRPPADTDPPPPPQPTSPAAPRGPPHRA